MPNTGAVDGQRRTTRSDDGRRTTTSDDGRRHTTTDDDAKRRWPMSVAAIGVAGIGSVGEGMGILLGISEVFALQLVGIVKLLSGHFHKIHKNTRFYKVL